jgi:hypothetical protein
MLYPPELRARDKRFQRRVYRTALVWFSRLPWESILEDRWPEKILRQPRRLRRQ